MVFLDVYESTRERSKLCKTIQETLHDKNALIYLMQFMESRSAASYVLCYLDVVSFKADLLHCRKGDHDNLSLSTCDSLTVDTASLNDSSDRVTQNSCDQDLSDSRSLEDVSITESALTVFKKYIAQEATHNIKCSEVIRNEIIENVCDSNTVLTGSCFEKVQDFCLETMNQYFEAFLASDFSVNIILMY